MADKADSFEDPTDEQLDTVLTNLRSQLTSLERKNHSSSLELAYESGETEKLRAATQQMVSNALRLAEGNLSSAARQQILEEFLILRAQAKALNSN